MQLAQRVQSEIGMRPRLLVGILAFLLYLPAFGWPFFADDYVHLEILQGDYQHPTLRSWNLYDFGTYGQMQGREEAMGVFPWWTDHDWKVRFYRPLTSLSLWLDFQIYGAHPLGFHLTNLLLFLLIVYGLYPLYRSWGLPPSAAFWSGLVYVCLDDLVTPVSWPANRNTLLATLFLLLTTLMTQKARKENPFWLLGAVLASLAAALAKESGAVGFLIVAAGLIWHSYEFQKILGGLLYRISLMLALVLPFSYLSALILGGYGTRSLFYATPWHSPENFLQHLGILVATAGTNLAMPFSLDALLFFPKSFAWLFWLGTIPGLLLLVPLLRRIWRESSLIVPGLLWLGVTLIPQATAPVSNRLFFLPFVGGVTLLGVFIAREKESSKRGTRSLFFWLVVVLCLPVSAAATLTQEMALGSFLRLNRQSVLALSSLLTDREQEVIVLQSPYSLSAFSAAWTYYGETGDRSKRFHLMQIGRRSLTWTRLDENSFTLESPEDFLTGPFERLFLSGSTRLAPGLDYESDLMQVEILEMGTRGVRNFRVHLEASLDSPGLIFLRAEGDGWTRIDPPPIGRSIQIPVPKVSKPFAP